jgi:putative ABC transport system permease protein
MRQRDEDSMNALLQDLRFALRQLRRSPGFTIAALLTLALGIGATTAVFSVVNTVVLRPLPYPEPDRFTNLGWQWGGEGDPNPSITTMKFAYWREHASVFEGIATYQTFSADLRSEAGLEEASAMRVSEDFFTVLGWQMSAGRAFTAEEDRPGGAGVAVISHRLWEERYGARPDILGRTVAINDEAHEIVGVAHPDTRLAHATTRPDVFVPRRLVPDPQDLGHNTIAIARVRSGVDRGAVQADLDRVLHAFRADHPNQAGAAEPGMRLLGFQQIYLGDTARNLWILLGAVGFVLLIGCVNLANLAPRPGDRAQARAGGTSGRGRGAWSDRAAARHREPGPGCDRRRHRPPGCRLAIRCAGGARTCGDPASRRGGNRHGCIRFCGRDGAPHRPALRHGGGAARHAWGPGGIDPGGSERPLGRATSRRGAGLAGGRGGRGGRGSPGRGGALVATFLTLRGEEAGFDHRNVLVVDFPPRTRRAHGARRARGFQREARERLAAIPGVVAVGATSTVPLAGQYNIPITIAGRPDATEPAAQWRAITPGYLDALARPLVRGRDVTEADGAAGPYVVLVNETFARHYFADTDPLGQRVQIAAMGGAPIHPDFEIREAEIVGVIGDARELGVDVPPVNTIYVPQPQAQPQMTSMPSFLVRTAPGRTPTAEVAAAFRELDPRLPLPASGRWRSWWAPRWPESASTPSWWPPSQRSPSCSRSSASTAC